MPQDSVVGIANVVCIVWEGQIMKKPATPTEIAILLRSALQASRSPINALRIGQDALLAVGVVSHVVFSSLKASSCMRRGNSWACGIS